MSMLPPMPPHPSVAAPTPSTIPPPTAPTSAPVPKSSVPTGHSDVVHDAQLDFYGRRLATCSSDRTVKIFAIDRSGVHRHEATLEGHRGPVWHVAWAHPTRHGNPILASASYDGRVIVWMEETPGMWRQIYEYAWHASSVNCVAFAPYQYGLIFACASSDGFVSICTRLEDGTWDERRVSESRDGGAHTHPLGANSVAWAPALQPGGLWMPERSSPPAMRIVSGGCDDRVKVWKWDEQTKNWVLEGAPLKGHREMVRSVAWAPNVGLTRWVIASGGQDKRVLVWSREMGKGEGVEWSMIEVGKGFKDVVWSVSWSPTGNLLGVAYGDDKVALWKEELDGKWKDVTEVKKDDAAGGEGA